VGAVGHIACARVCAPGAGGNGATGLVDTFYFYDHIGNVQGASDTSGALASTCAQDALGNVLSSLTTGAWSSSPSGRHHMTKEYDTNIEQYYVFQRWLASRIGVFLSKSPFAPKDEHFYIFVESNPITYYDPMGLITYYQAMSRCAREWGNNYNPPNAACRSGAANACAHMKQCLADYGFKAVDIRIGVRQGMIHDICQVIAPDFKCTLERHCFLIASKWTC
jgi:RHS repeat-associated protein